MYKAIVSELENVRKHPNADRLQLATVVGSTVIVGLKAKSGDLGLFFPSDGQLSSEFAKANDLVRRKDESGKAAGGFFEENRRVRSLTLRGVKSEGFWTGISSLEFTKCRTYLKSGDQISIYDGVPICNKYMTQGTREKITKDQKAKTFKSSRELPGLTRHWDTPQLRHCIRAIEPEEATVIITEKLHGTSGRFSNVQIERESYSYECSSWTRLKSWITRKPLPSVKEWKHTSGTRNVILDEDNTSGGFYGSNSFRHKAVDSFRGKLKKGEAVFFEIVGYTNNQAPIMAPQATKKLKDKELSKEYGESMEYSYGCTSHAHTAVTDEWLNANEEVCYSYLPQTDIYIYRISRTTEDGHELDLSWSQVKARCLELDIKHVPELSTMTITRDVKEYIQGIETIIEGFKEGPSTIDESHIREGVCVRIEYSHLLTPKIYKAKSWTFGVLEGYLKDNSDFVDMEEAS